MSALHIKVSKLPFRRCESLSREFISSGSYLALQLVMTLVGVFTKVWPGIHLSLRAG